RYVDGLAGIGDVDDEFGRAIALAGGRIERGHPEPDRLAPLELIVQQTITWVTWGGEVAHVTQENQGIARRLAGERRWRKRRHHDDRGAANEGFHALKVTESLSSVQSPGALRRYCTPCKRSDVLLDRFGPCGVAIVGEKGPWDRERIPSVGDQPQAVRNCL